MNTQNTNTQIFNASALNLAPNTLPWYKIVHYCWNQPFFVTIAHNTTNASVQLNNESAQRS